MNKDFKEILITQEELKKRAKEIANAIDKKYGNKEIIIVGLLKGSYVFVADVVREIKNPNVNVEFLVASSYKNGTSTKEVKIVLDLKKPIEGKSVIILEDIIDTGRTLSKIKKLFISREAHSVEIAAMCTKPSRREVYVELDYPSFEIPNEIIVGYGLDYNERYRHLPYVASLNEKALERLKEK